MGVCPVINRERLTLRIREHEGYSAMPYQDHLGYWTVGYGKNIHNMKIRATRFTTIGQALAWLTDPKMHESWLQADIDNAVRDAQRWLGDAWDNMTPQRREVVAEMAYQMGLPALTMFVRFKEAVAHEQWDEAASEMLKSRWAKQTPERAKKLSRLFASETA